jgi:hypothetical protein
MASAVDKMAPYEHPGISKEDLERMTLKELENAKKAGDVGAEAELALRLNSKQSGGRRNRRRTRKPRRKTRSRRRKYSD